MRSSCAKFKIGYTTSSQVEVRGLLADSSMASIMLPCLLTESLDLASTRRGEGKHFQYQIFTKGTHE